MAPRHPLDPLNALIERGAPSTREFQKVVLAYFKKAGRSFPWRETADPYKILVSEIMLQQTQTERVIEKYRSFLRAFPTVKRLALASQSDVVREWMGLGYYRRAKNLHRAAQAICDEHGGKVPCVADELRALPGIGAYTASAILAFAFGVPTAMIETNIRTVFIHTFFTDRQSVKDTEILERVEETLYGRDPRVWYYALMDLGVELKKTAPDVNKRSAHYKKQSPFVGSQRQVRAAVLRVLTEGKTLTATDLEAQLGYASEKITHAITSLSAEGFISQTRGGRYRIASS